MEKDKDLKEKERELKQAKTKPPPIQTFIETYHADLRADLQTYMQGDSALRRQLERKLYRDFLSAAERGNPQTLQIYLDTGIDVNFQDPKTGQTALHVSSASRAREAVRVLLASGKCDYLIRDRRGRLASELAYLYGEDPALARLLGNKERKQAERYGMKLTRKP